MRVSKLLRHSIVLLAGSVANLSAQKLPALSSTAGALDAIAAFAERICPAVKDSAARRKLELNGTAKADLRNLIKQLVGVEGAVAARYVNESSQGVLQGDLAVALRDNENCRLAVLSELKKALLTRDTSELGRARDSSKALRHCESTGSSTPDEMFQRGKRYEDGGDYFQAACWYRRSASAGFAPAMNNLGNLCERGLGVTMDLNQANHWFEESAKKGDAVGMANRGYNYQHGLGTSPDYARAADLFRQAADLGNARAMRLLGQVYEHGTGVPEAVATAAGWYQQAADLGDTIAMCQLGELYRTGKGVTQDLRQAKLLFTRADAAHNNCGTAGLRRIYSSLQ